VPYSPDEPAQWTTLILLDERGRRHAVDARPGIVSVPGVGTFEGARLLASVGRRITVGTKSFLVLTPSLRDLHETMDREAQTLVPKDLAAILFEVSLSAGMRVAEAGVGSGGLTMALAWTVRPSGRVVGYDVRRESLRLAAANVERAGLSAYVDFREKDVRKGIQDRDLDALVLDLPDPWMAIPAAWEALRPCGHLACFSPNMEQVKQTAEAIRARPFVDLRTVELIEREMEVRNIGVRPSFAPLGHTGYLTFARKVLDTF
jgi:tRNA (adenine57-N1/adenine58-N1)-methyltransferase catalytic subunit